LVGVALAIVFVILVGPLSIFYGVDSRITRDPRGWWPATPRRSRID
jgi:hypothetical protein